MLFNSFVFFLFLLFFFSFWPFMARSSHRRWIYITATSFFFYGWWDWRYLFLLIGTGLVDYAAGIAMEKWPRHKKQLLWLSMITNIGTLAAFKYTGFFLSNVNALFHFMGNSAPMPMAQFVLPIGISFYTFASMSYTIDVYRNEIKPTRNVFHFFAFLSMFPHLVAGPIIRASALLPQLKEWKDPSNENRWAGLQLIVVGYFKKTVVADNLALVVNEGFGTAGLNHSSLYWWVVVTAFAFQIYCDFSGYSDIARGLAKWIGYEFPVNFNHPYVAKSFGDFWNRWHISLSSWFRDYVYIPLGGSRGSTWKTYRNIWLTMVLSGFWHGAAWTFIIWGALHALYLTVEKITGWPWKLERLRGGRVLVTFLILVQVWVGWVFFRASSVREAVMIIGHMFTPNSGGNAFGFSVGRGTVLLLFVVMILWEIGSTFKATDEKKSTTAFGWIGESVLMSVMIAASLFLRGPGSAFIYFQF